MSWLYSRALVEEYLAESSLDGERSVPSKLNHMPQAFLSSDRMTEFSHLSQFGMTFELLTEDLGVGLLTWFLEGFPARTSALQEKERESTANDPDFIGRCAESLAKYDLNSRSWKTHQLSLLGGLSEFSGAWPRWGMMLDGELYRQRMPDFALNVNEYGYLPAPTKCDWKERGDITRLANVWKNKKYKHQKRPIHWYSANIGEEMPAEFVEHIMGWPVWWTDLRPLAMDKFQMWLH